MTDSDVVLIALLLSVYAFIVVALAVSQWMEREAMA